MRDFVKIDAALAHEILAAVVDTDPWDAAVHLALGLGLRRGEVLGLRWDDIDDAVHVRRSVSAAGGKRHIGDPKTAAGLRDLPFPRFVAEALERHREARAERMRAYGIGSMFVVDRADGTPWEPATFSGEWRKFATGKGFEGITFHNLRHGAATLLLASGVPDGVAIEILGHSTTKILKRYQSVVDELKHDAAARMDRLLGEGGIS